MCPCRSTGHGNRNAGLIRLKFWREVSLAGCVGSVRDEGFAKTGPGGFLYSAHTNTVMTVNDDGSAERLRRDCPWDRVQTARTIVPHTVEEAYEVADAALAGDDEKLLGELGEATGPVRDLDVLLEHVREELDGLDEPDRAAGATLVATLERELETARRRLLDAPAGGGDRRPHHSGQVGPDDHPQRQARRDGDAAHAAAPVRAVPSSRLDGRWCCRRGWPWCAA